MSEKSRWEKPMVIVLGRGRPEEQVLAACKQKLVTGSGGRPQCGVGGPGACSGLGQS